MNIQHLDKASLYLATLIRYFVINLSLQVCQAEGSQA